MNKQIIKTPNEFRDFCSKLKPIFSFDTETTSLKWLELEIIGFSISDGQQACYVDLTPQYKQELLMILDYYIRESKMIIGHNISFDLMVLRKEGISI